jgi:hypothetical protein
MKLPPPPSRPRLVRNHGGGGGGSSSAAGLAQSREREPGSPARALREISLRGQRPADSGVDVLSTLGIVVLDQDLREFDQRDLNPSNPPDSRTFI